jgi:ABC-2 type transport system permease protein
VVIAAAAAICRRDLRQAFTTPLAWLVLCCWVAIIHLVFVFVTMEPVRDAGAAGQPLFTTALRWGGLLLTMLAPAITMSSFTSERERDTLPLLMTLPITDGALVLGKFAAAWLLLLSLLVARAGIPLTLYLVSDPGGWQLVSGYLGLALQAALLAALGVWISMLVDNPLPAYVLTFAAIAILQLLGVAGMNSGSWLGAIGSFAGLGGRLHGFISGDVALGSIAYFVVGTAVFLIAARGSLEGVRRGF